MWEMLRGFPVIVSHFSYVDNLECLNEHTDLGWGTVSREVLLELSIGSTLEDDGDAVTSLRLGTTPQLTAVSRYLGLRRTNVDGLGSAD